MTSTRLNKKVFVGMSGGVDSSVSAALLKKAGYDVTGVFIKVWQPDEEITGLRCTWREDRLDAMRVAAQLGIKFVTLDLEKEYKENVVDYMIADYRAGRTPNPDIMCNKHVKFGGFFKWAMAQGADYVATGHYAQVVAAPAQVSGVGSVGAHVDLLAGNDMNKDQSYFLWTLSQDQLSKTLFPVGNIEKPEVRKLAKKFGLSTAEKKDSQGLCFIGKINVKDFLSHYIEPRVGNVLDSAGHIIGSHTGAALFTMGERHGFSIDDAHKTPHDEAYYVVSKDIATNTITVSNKSSEKIAGAGDQSDRTFTKKEIILTDVNWTRGCAPVSAGSSSNRLLMARPRYRAPLVQVSISLVDDAAHTCKIIFNEPQETLSAGQSLVIYDGSICLGGGIIS